MKNLEKVFKQLGEPAQAEPCPGFEGIKQEHEEFMQERPSQDVLDVFLTGAAARTEHYEIAAYTGLVTMAKALGEREVVTLLEANLKQEKETLRAVEKIGRRLSKRGRGRLTKRRRASDVRGSDTGRARDRCERHVPRCRGSGLRSGPVSSAAKSSGQWRAAFRNGIGAAWPRPQIDVRSIVSSHSSTWARGITASPCSSRSTRWWSARLPMRHGVHFWHDSSAKKRIVSASRRSTG